MLLDVVFINESTVVTDEELQPIIQALQHQVWHDFRIAWGVTGVLTQLPKGTPAPADRFWIGIFDDFDQARALGYGDLTPAGFPMAKVFAKTDLKYRAKLSVSLSYELLGMLVNPYINQCVIDPQTSRLYAKEVCDPVEADAFGYTINGIKVSDFVLPAYFDPQHVGRRSRLSLQGHVNEPFSLARGGCLSYLDLHDLRRAGWKQEVAALSPGATGAARLGERESGFPPGSRRERMIRAMSGMLIVSDLTAEASAR